ncbi:MAG: EAL domain-containing protein [Desulfobulbaceae bacterium]|nr:EAL domain-containing protein [Desulfobulbaceae bacterium]
MGNKQYDIQDSVVLVVDDDIAQRLLMTETLLEKGLHVEEAEDGVEALEIFENMSPDLVLMDVKMPKMDGFTACTKMRELPGGRDVAIVLVTGLDDFDSIEQSFGAGATDFITKPVNWPLLSHRIFYLLRASKAFLELRQNEKNLSIAQQIACLGNWDWNLHEKNITCSPQIFSIFGLEPQESGLTHEVFLQSVHPEDLKHVQDTVKKSLEQRKKFSIDYRIVLPGGAVRTVHEQAEVVCDQLNQPVSMHGTIQDITERVKNEEKIYDLAYFDELTGLPNRKLFREHVGQTLFVARREGKKVALLYLDLDRFKRINDTLGHSAGDHLLKKISAVLSESIRSSDILAKSDLAAQSHLAVSRLGGDEFTIMLTGLAEEKDAARVAQRILNVLREPMLIAGQEIYISCSIGIASYPEDGEDAEVLLKNAEVAMYHGKESGRNTFQFFSGQMTDQALERLSLETALKKAIERSELVLYYQPQIDLSSGKTCGLEALVRWNHPDLGMVSPGKFIPLAEESGLIVPIGEWVMQKACEQMCEWQRQGFLPVRMGVNISSHQFRLGDLVATVRNVLKSTGLESRYLELELTESAIMKNVDKVIDILNELKKIGVNLSVDDFGTGYSSMSYLKRFPLNTLKIDRSFVMDITTDPNDAAIIKAIIALSKSLGLKTIAEGVETEEQLEFLKVGQCDEIQGFFISRPLPADEVKRFLRTD